MDGYFISIYLLLKCDISKNNFIQIIFCLNTYVHTSHIYLVYCTSQSWTLYVSFSKFCGYLVDFDETF